MNRVMRRARARCVIPGCRCDARRGLYCDAHAPPKPAQRRRKSPEADRARGSDRWQRMRAVMREQYPVCANPFGYERHYVRTEVIHHIIPLADAGENAPYVVDDPANLAPLCRACHDRIESMERRGHRTAPLFDGWRERYEWACGDESRHNGG